MDIARIEEKQGRYIVYVKRDSGEIPVFETKDKSQAQLMYKYYTEE